MSANYGLTKIRSGYYVDYDDNEQIGRLRKIGREWHFKMKRSLWVGPFRTRTDARRAMYSAWLDRKMEELDARGYADA